MSSSSSTVIPSFPHAIWLHPPLPAHGGSARRRRSPTAQTPNRVRSHPAGKPERVRLVATGELGEMPLTQELPGVPLVSHEVTKPPLCVHPCGRRQRVKQIGTGLSLVSSRSGWGRSREGKRRRVDIARAGTGGRSTARARFVAGTVYPVVATGSVPAPTW